MPTSQLRLLSVLCLFGALAGFMPSAEAAEIPSIDEVLKRLGYTDQDKKALLAGRIIATDVERTREDQLIAAVALRIDTPLSTLAENVKRGRNIERDPGAGEFGVMTEAAHREQLEAVSFPETAEVKRLLSVAPDGTFNLSSAEIESLRKSLKKVKSADPGAAAAASDAYRSILAGRFQAYLKKGFEGIADYDHGGTSLAPADQLRAVHAQVEPFFEEFFPAFGRAVRGFPDGQSADISNRIYWMRRDVEGRPAFILVHQTVQAGDGFVLMSQRQFFVGHTYESLQAYALALSLEKGSAVFYLNSAFTDKVAGFFSGVAHSVGQGRMKEDLDALFRVLREKNN